MDETKSPKRKADGIRRTVDSVIPKRPLRAAPMRPSARTSKDNSDQQSADGSAVLQDEMKGRLQAKRSVSQKTSVLDVPIVEEKIFEKLVLPKHVFLFKNKNILALMLGIGIAVIIATLLSTVFAQVTVSVKPTVESIQL